MMLHGHASVERFSASKEILVENLHEESLIAQRIIYDALSDAGGIQLKEPTQMIHSMRNAFSRFKESEEHGKKVISFIF